MKRYFIARHGETVFNAAARLQGDTVHTPLTRAGFAQAEEMGRALRDRLGARPELRLWASPTGRALQTLAVIAEHLDLDWHEARTDKGLDEIAMGDWGGLLYRDAAGSAGGPIVDPATHLFSRRAPGGEWYDDIATRLQSWVDAQAHEEGDRLVVMHGISSRVLRGMLTRAAHRPGCGAPVADGLPQGSVVEIADGVETMLAQGGGTAPA
jgi:broad specificity phosphatase PhoE